MTSNSAEIITQFKPNCDPAIPFSSYFSEPMKTYFEFMSEFTKCLIEERLPVVFEQIKFVPGTFNPAIYFMHRDRGNYVTSLEFQTVDSVWIITKCDDYSRPSNKTLRLSFGANFHDVLTHLKQMVQGNRNGPYV